MHFPHTDPFFKMPYVLAAVGLTAAAFFVVQAKYCRTRKTQAPMTTAADETTAKTARTTVSALTAPPHTPEDSSDDEEKAGDHNSSHSGGAGAKQQMSMARNEVEMTGVL